MISIIVPTYNRAELLRDRCLPSILDQTYRDWECHVVGDGTDAKTALVMMDLVARDWRFRFTNLSHSVYPEDEHARWQAMGIPPINYGLDHALGEWVCVLADDDAYPANRTEVLLGAVGDADFVYGRTEVVGHGVYGSWPPNGDAFTDGAYLMRRLLEYRYDAESWKRDVIADYDLRSRIVADGVKMAYTPEIVYRYWPANKVPPT